ncbi:MAG: GNAT family N-acetyltransferase [Clostridia bacterium]|nr:GNAT family N-acetyltransferase [Clostridia bacterium]
MYKLRELEREDLKKINKWRNDPNLIACLGAPYRYINEDVDQEWYDKYLHARSNSVRCAIVDEEKENEVLGLISLLNINYINRTGELHIMIGGSENRGKGIGTFAVRAMIAHAFNNLNLHRIELGVLETNAAALRLYEKTGFVREGVKRKSNYKNGKYINMIFMGLLKEECSMEASFKYEEM